MNIKITRVDGAILITPAPDYITSYLQYSHRSFGLKGWKRVNIFTKKELYSLTDNNDIVTWAGFFDKVAKLVTNEGDNLTVNDLRTPVSEPSLEAIKDINWEGIGSEGLKDYQIQPLVEFLYKAKEGNGVVSASGGWGKTILMACTYAAFSHIGQTILATPLKTVFDQTYDKFTKLFPKVNIGRVGDGYYDISPEITITTFKSLQKAPLEKCKLMLIDEIQGTTSEGIVRTLSGITPVRMFGYTATDKNLFNQADKMIKGLFGERLIYIPYEDAEDKGAVVPFKVYMVKVPDTAVFDANTIEAKLVRGIKRNSVRNRLIGQVCSMIPDGWQTLVFVDHIADHLIPLYKEMPEGTIYVHRGQDKNEFGAFALTTKQQEKNLQDFVNGKYQYLIGSDCLRSGFDSPQLKVIVQASGGTSSVELLQEAYRGARTYPGKTHCVLIDMYDSHDQTLENMSLKRIDVYKKQGWDVKIVEDVKDINWELEDTKPKSL